MFKLGLEKVGEPEIKLPIFAGSQRTQRNSSRTIQISKGCHQGVAFDMSANLEDPAVATGLEKVNPHPNSQEK